ncbi:MAG: choice-of-anchor B family protein [Crocinitomicaceae bacterium]|nr:choice-of-anchor B family protein [Crocinitomicaceae bacterium]
MLKLSLQLFAVLLISTTAHSQFDLNLLGQHQYAGNRGDCSDIWGYVDGLGNEYAIVGNETGTSIVDVTDPANPVEVLYTAGDQTIWRDMKVWGTTAYITNESGGGLKIIDLSNLPGPLTGADVTYYTGSSYQFETAHNIFMDENGHAYICGSDYNNTATIILDVSTTPLAPVELGVYDDFYLHDLYVRGDTLWGGAINDGFFVVVDVTDPMNCVTMATHLTPTTFSHNVWLSDDGNTLYTTDEVSDAYVASYDVSNIANIVERDRVQSSPGDNVIPHNTFVVGDYLVTSYYRDGVVITDATNPANLIQVGSYDTSPLSGDGFNGDWGVYPYLPSGNIIVSDIENGLFILGSNYSPGAYLEGNVTDFATTNPIDNAQIEIVATSILDNSDASGDYASGVATGGTFDVTFSKLGYVSQTISNVVLTNGNTTILDVALISLITFTLQGEVQDENGSPIPNVQVVISNSQFSTTVTTNGLGVFDVLSFLEGPYSVSMGLWGYHGLCLTNESYTISGGPYVYEMQTGYTDIFELDLGWSVSGNPDSGDWERDEPSGTSYQGDWSNPEDDSDDCGEMAYITGNGGGSAGSDDIDDGTTILTSPTFDLSTYADPYLSFERWFFNAGGQGSTPNDSLVVDITNGTQTVRRDFADINSPDLSSWAYREFRVTDYLPATAIMQMKIRAMDIGQGHLSEGGFDDFYVWDDTTSTNPNIGILEITNDELVNIYPVPFANEINIVLDQVFESVHVDVIDLSSGKLIDSRYFIAADKIQLNNNYAKGMYLIRVYGDDSILTTRRVVKM